MNQQTPCAADSSLLEARMLVDGQWRAAKRQVPVFDPYRGVQIGIAPESDADDLEAALVAATRAKAEVAAMPAFERADM